MRKRILRTILLLLLTLWPTLVVWSAEQCAANSRLVGECWNLRGRIQLYDSPPIIRMWVVGSDRLLGLNPEQSPIMPEKVRRHLRPNVAIYADYTVCPFTAEKPGLMQMVCVDSAEHIKKETYNGEGSVTMIEFIK